MPHSSHADVTILMPAYQLESTISDNIERVASVVADWDSTEIIVIDDGSTDDTHGFADKTAAEHNIVTVISYQRNRGKGGALKEGFNVAEGSTIVFLDADLDLPPEQLPLFLDEFAHTGADVIVGAKRSAMASGRYPTMRKMLSVTFAAVNRLLFGLPVHETQTGLKAFKREVLERPLRDLETAGYAFDLELLVRIRKAGGTMAEAPVTLAEGSSKGLSLVTVWEIGRDTLRIWWRSLRWK